MQEIAGLGDVAGAFRNSGFLQLLDLGQRRLAHRLPVFDRGAHFGEHRQQVFVQLLGIGRGRQAVDLDMHDAFELMAFLAARLADTGEAPLGVAGHREDGMHEQMDVDLALLQRRRQAVDEEGHIVIDDLDDAMIAIPAGIVIARQIDAELGLARLALGNEIEQGGAAAEQCVGVALQHILGRHIGVGGADQPFGENLLGC